MAEQPQYVFTRDFIDSNRINLQHYQWTRLFGYLLHPSIPTNDPSLKVADVATGTGIWLTDLGTSLPSTVQLDGLDLSLEATPPVEWLPANVRFRHWDIKGDVPQDLLGVYDIVHVRLLSFVLLDTEIPEIVSKMAKLLKPGGYLQWAEPDVASFRIEKTKPGNETSALSSLLAASQSKDPRLSPTWVPKLPAHFADFGGLIDVQADVRDAPGHLALSMHECNLMLHELLARTTRSEALSAELRELMPKVLGETKNGACWAFTRYTVVARKPPVASLGGGAARDKH